MEREEDVRATETHILDSHFSRARRDECIKIKGRKKNLIEGRNIEIMKKDEE